MAARGCPCEYPGMELLFIVRKVAGLSKVSLALMTGYLSVGCAVSGQVGGEGGTGRDCAESSTVESESEVSLAIGDAAATAFAMLPQDWEVEAPSKDSEKNEREANLELGTTYWSLSVIEGARLVPVTVPGLTPAGSEDGSVRCLRHLEVPIMIRIEGLGGNMKALLSGSARITEDGSTVVRAWCDAAESDREREDSEVVEIRWELDGRPPAELNIPLGPAPGNAGIGEDALTRCGSGE